MKRYISKGILGLLIIGLLLNCSFVDAQLLEVYKITNSDIDKINTSGLSQLFSINMNKSDTTDYYKIKLKNDTSDFGKFSYPIKANLKSIDDTLLLIQELLSFEGDKRLCVLPIRCYNPLISQIYTGEIKSYSIQVEALFLINQLYFKEPYKYSPYPMLINEKGVIESISGKIINEAFKNYKEWYKILKNKGLEISRKENIEPLKNSGIRWYP